MAPERVLVTGAGGFVASHMLEYLAGRALELRATDLATADRTFVTKAGAEFITADLTKPETLQPLVKDVDAIFHLAAVFDLNAKLELLRTVNVEGTKHLLEAAANEDVKHIIIWSSATVYGEKLQRCPVDETYPPKPKGRYALSKLEQEQLAMRYWKENGMPVTVIRPTLIYGPRNTYGFATAVFTFAEGKIPFLPGDGTAKVNNVNVADVVGAAVHLASKNDTIGETYNISDDSVLTINEYMGFLAELFNRPPLKRKMPGGLVKFYGAISNWWANLRNKRPLLEKESIPYLLSDHVYKNDKLKGTGYELDYPDFKIGLRETVEWYLEHGYIKS